MNAKKIFINRVFCLNILKLQLAWFKLNRKVLESSIPSAVVNFASACNTYVEKIVLC